MPMKRRLIALMTPAALVALVQPAFAHHVMGGRMPATFGEGILSGLGHPVIGLDHFAAVVAVGCLAAAHRQGAALALAFVVAMMCGVAVHLQAVTVPAAEILVAVSVILLGAIVIRRSDLPLAGALALFVLVGLIHGYALGESIYGAERTPLYAYLLGLAVIQSAIALAAMTIARMLMRSDAVKLRLIGAGIAGIGLAVLVQQILPAPPT
jgi:urease accessory protein